MAYEHIWVLMVLAWILGWGALVIVARYLRNRSRIRLREMIHKERMLAMEKGVPLGELPDQISLDGEDSDVGVCFSSSGDWDRKVALGLGLVFLFGGIGIILGFYLVPASEATEEFRDLGALGLIPALTGLGLLLYYRMSRIAPS